MAGVDEREVAKSLLVSDFDAAATCKLAGFASVDEYYQAGSSAQFIREIKTPTLLMASEDDPFLGRLPVHECRGNEHTVLATTRVGGHCAHLRGLLPLGPSWADDAVMQFFTAVQNALSGSAETYA